MAESSCIVSLPQMIDLALNCPEPGAVNFKILHSLLHVIVQQIDLSSCTVEIRGDSGEKMQHLLSNTKITPSIALTEYSVTPDSEGKKPVSKKKGKKASKKASKEDAAKDEPARKTSKEKTSKTDSTISFQTIVVIEAAEEGVQAPHVSVAVPKASYEEMQNDIKTMKLQIQDLTELPENTGLIEALRSAEDDKTPLVDLFQILSLTKRIDGVETGISKLASMMEDLAKATAGEGEEEETEKMDIGGEKWERMQERVQAIEGFLGLISTDTEDGGKSESRAPVPTGGLTVIKDDVALLKHKLGDFETLLQYFPMENLLEALRDLEELRNKLLRKTSHTDQSDLPPDLRLNEMDSKLNEYNQQIFNLDTMFKNQICLMQGQLGNLESELGGLVERINTGLPAGDATLSSGIPDQSVGELYSRIVTLQTEIENLQENSQKLLEEKEERQRHLDVLKEQIELLKTIKADKEDLEEALADKADACAINRKVSHDQFDAACDDLSRGIEDALSKLTQQETLWQQALDDIQREIGNKLDKMELTPLRDFVNKKLKTLQDKMKALATMKKDQEAAGTKAKLLRNVNCISCDKDVVMRTEMDPSLMPKPVALPPTRSMGPYLAYELDALRKQQKCVPGSRNLHHFESAIIGAKTPREDDHLCNRYCGGSHTTTTPQQRVTRLGHFLKQWGNETDVQEGQIRGTDGQMYKAQMKVQMLAAESASLISGTPGAEHGATRPLTVSPADRKTEIRDEREKPAEPKPEQKKEN